MKIILLSLVFILSFSSYSQNDYTAKVDSIEKTFTYQHGIIKLSNGVGNITIPKGFKYLNSTQAERVLFELWGNPKADNMTLGLLLPEEQGVLDQKGYVFNVQYDEIGYVKDDDADDIDYDDLLIQMRKDSEIENVNRKKKAMNL